MACAVYYSVPANPGISSRSGVADSARRCPCRHKVTTDIFVHCQQLAADRSLQRGFSRTKLHTLEPIRWTERPQRSYNFNKNSALIERPERSYNFNKNSALTERLQRLYSEEATGETPWFKHTSNGTQGANVMRGIKMALEAP